MDDPPGPTRVADLLTAAAARVPDHPAVVDLATGVTLTWSDLDAAASAEAHRVLGCGVRPGDRVVVRLGNGAACAVALLGALRAGALVVPHGGSAVPPAGVLSDCAPVVLVAAPEDTGAAAAAAGFGVAVLGPPDVTARAAAPDRPPGDGEDIALLVYASASGASARGIRLSHRALLANRAQVAALRPAPVIPVDRVLLALPMVHSYGLGAGFLQVCWSAATLVLPAAGGAAELADTLLAHRVSALAGVPATFRALLELPAARLREATGGLRLCTSGGAALPTTDLLAFRAATGLPIVEGYGLTEAGPVVTSNAVDAPKPGSVGRPLPGVELRLTDLTPADAPGPDADADPEEEDDFDPADGTGVVTIRGANLFSGYWPDGAGGPDAEGWFRTSDVGFLDPDGDLHLVDRSSDLVVVNGFTVYPREVEQVLAQLPEVAEAAVIGVPDGRTGAAVRALLVRVAGAELDEAAVRAHCERQLARFKVPTVVEFVDALPRTPTGRIAHRQLAAERGRS